MPRLRCVQSPKPRRANAVIFRPSLSPRQVQERADPHAAASGQQSVSRQPHPLKPTPSPLRPVVRRPSPSINTQGWPRRPASSPNSGRVRQRRSPTSRTAFGTGCRRQKRARRPLSTLGRTTFAWRLRSQLVASAHHRVIVHSGVHPAHTSAEVSGAAGGFKRKHSPATRGRRTCHLHTYAECLSQRDERVAPRTSARYGRAGRKR